MTRSSRLADTGLAATADEGWNPRYVLYARLQGRDPDAQLAHDRETYPGGGMAAYILWAGEQWAAFHAEKHARGSYHRCLDCGFAARAGGEFDAWLLAKYPQK